jgi:peptidyl-prolyl cis-trans isomerase B (cyclophilin B)
MNRVLLILALASLVVSSVHAQKKSSEPNPVAYADSQVVLRTSMGDIVLDLYPDVAPKHVLNFTKLANTGFYDSLTFHRVIKEMLLQGGDPKGNGTGKGPNNVPSEFSSLHHTDGILSMARSSDPNSASCQFFICLRSFPPWDGNYSIFGKVADSASLRVAHTIGEVPTSGKQRPPALSDCPLKPVYIVKAYVRPKPKP